MHEYFLLTCGLEDLFFFFFFLLFISLLEPYFPHILLLQSHILPAVDWYPFVLSVLLRERLVNERRFLFKRTGEHFINEKMRK